MHVPRNPPEIEAFLHDEQMSKEVLSEGVREYAKKYNTKYLHWSEVRMRDTGTYHPDAVWARMKLVRTDNNISLVFGNTRFHYGITDNMMRLLREFDSMATGGLFPEAIDTHKKVYYSVSSAMEESIASSQMEGAVTTTKVAKEILRKNLRPKDKSERMIVNNYHAMLFIKDNLSQPLTPDLIGRIHEIVTDGTLGERYRGVFRDNDNVVVQDAFSGEVYHQPIPHEEIDPSIRQLCEFINDDSDFLHPVIKGIILHYVLAFIHPFEDGNGRVARSLFYWYELKHGYWPFEYLALSRYIKEHKGKYEEAYVFGETDGNDMNYFILYNLKALIESVGRFKSYLTEKMEEERSTKGKLSGCGLNDRQMQIVAAIMGGSTVTVKSIQTQYSVSLNTARSDIRLLNDLGLLAESGREVNQIVYSWSGNTV